MNSEPEFKREVPEIVNHHWLSYIPKIRLFPLWDTIRSYRMKDARADASASVNVALLDFPQGMAYAMIAGLPVQFGIFCSALASIIGPVFASSRFVMLGPTNATAVMLLSTFLTMGYDPHQAMFIMPLLLVMVGVFMTLGAFFRVGGLVQYISRAVVIGYISAAAFLIIVNQLKTVFGLSVPRAGTFIESSWILIKNIGHVDFPSTLVAAATIAIYLPLKKWGKGLPNVAITLILIAFATHFLFPPISLLKCWTRSMQAAGPSLFRRGISIQLQNWPMLL